MLRITLLLFVVVLLLISSTNVARALPYGKGAWSCRRTAWAQPWHGGYYHTAWGMPVAVVVPPTAELQTHWGWGVGNTRVTPICPQFERHWPGPGTYSRRHFRPTPAWPSDTDQFGAYYVRGPW